MSLNDDSEIKKMKTRRLAFLFFGVGGVDVNVVGVVGVVDGVVLCICWRLPTCFAKFCKVGLL